MDVVQQKQLVQVVDVIGRVDLVMIGTLPVRISSSRKEYLLDVCQ